LGAGGLEFKSPRPDHFNQFQMQTKKWYFRAMRSFLYVLCAAVIPLLAPAAPAMPVCNDPRPRLVCAEYFASQLVVEATLIQTRVLPDKHYPEAYVYTLHVNRVLRGKIVATVSVYEGNDSGRAAFDWVRRKKYLLFLFYATDENAWTLDGCGNSGPLSHASKALAEIATIKTVHGGGVIHGVVGESLSTPLSGVRVEAVGKTGHYEATTNEKGEFQIDVPAGQYVVHALKSGLSFDKDDFSYEDPEHIQIEPGGCVQIQFDASLRRL
jgi:hypothetical protein